MLQDNLKRKLDFVSRQIQDILTPVELLSAEESQEIIQRWVAAIEGNFQAWLAGALIAAQSNTAKSVIQENLWLEIQENHASMLRQFAVSANAEPNATDFRAISEAVEGVRNLVAEMSGLKSVALMAVHENNRAFYPYLAELARKMVGTDFTYTNVHEVEDVEHAVEFQKALYAETDSDFDYEHKIDEVVAVLMSLYRSIFQLKSHCNKD